MIYNDPTNEDRAGWAQCALDAFAHTTSMDTAGEDDKTVLSDLLVDLMHWCDLNEVAFDEVLANAADTYAQEVEEDE